MNENLLLVVNPEVGHIGCYLKRAAEVLNINFFLCAQPRAFEAPFLSAKFTWHFLGHRPVRLHSFSQSVIMTCKKFRISSLLTTGLAPIEAKALEYIGKLGIRRINYLTDDPFSKAHYAAWFMRGLSKYDYIFSPRRSNFEDLKRVGSRNVFYLPFAFSPEVHYPDQAINEEERGRYESDIIFAGGADKDRVPYIMAFIRAKAKIILYGGYWERFKETRPYARGFADQQTLRKAIGCAKVSLCIVRKANRDGHSMRSFEIPAIGSCMLVEDTAEHREIFGVEGKAVSYFRNIQEMMNKFKWLLCHEAERKRLAQSARELILNGHNTYKDRLITMLNMSNVGKS